MTRHTMNQQPLETGHLHVQEDIVYSWPEPGPTDEYWATTCCGGTQRLVANSRCLAWNRLCRHSRSKLGHNLS